MFNFYTVKITQDPLVPMLTVKTRKVFDDGALGSPDYLEWRGYSPAYGQKEETLTAHGCGGVDVPHSLPKEDLEFFQHFLRSWHAGPCRDGDMEVLADPARLPGHEVEAEHLKTEADLRTRLARAELAYQST